MDPIIETSQVQVSAMSFGPWAIARVGGKSVMIPAAVPGDLLEIGVVSEKHDYALASIVRVLQPAPERREPPCPYASSCGGCDWQHIRYEAQARLKSQVVADEFRRTIGIELNPEGLVEPAPAEFRYRTRVRLKNGPAGKIGFNHLSSNSFVPVDDCLVAAPPIQAAARLGSALGRDCTEIEVVAAQHGQVLIALLTKVPGAFERKIGRQILGDGVAGLILRHGAIRELFGEVTVACEVEPGCTIEADADLFSQVNRAQNVKLVAAVMQLAELSPHTRVLDLFCGTGNFSLPAARRGARVTGVDHDQRAIEAARANVKRMDLPGAQFMAMRAVDGVRFLLQAGYLPEVLILDPPRAGAASLMEPISRFKARRLIYVSCDLSTMVRDLRRLILKSYRIHAVRGFDFFPNTHHVEIIASLVLT
jgi:23S rRNA (uracil1939-C5)-methyltransferase